MSQLPKGGPKTPEMAAEIALRVLVGIIRRFSNTGSAVQNPLALRVADHNIEDKKVQLTVVSGQAAELPPRNRGRLQGRDSPKTLPA